MNSKPLVTVLMAAYNKEKLIVPAIESFLRQTYSNIELLICDDNSTDHTAKVVLEYCNGYKNISFYKNEKNIGFIKTMNGLFAKATGDFICILDSDDWMADNRVEHQLKMIQDYKADCVISEFIMVRSNGKLEPNAIKSTIPRFLKPRTQDVFWPSGSIFMCRPVIETLKGYHEYFADTFSGDAYFVNQIVERFKVLYDPTHLYYYRMVTGSMTNTIDLYKQAKAEIVGELIEQRKHTNTDWLEQGNFAAIEERLRYYQANKQWQSAKYQIFAARCIDDGDYGAARKYLLKAFIRNPFSINSFKTLKYLITQSFSKSHVDWHTPATKR